MIARRTFLQAVGIGAVATWSTSCTDRPQPPGQPSTGVSPSSVTPEPPDWAALRTRLPGGLVLPGEPTYDSARRAYNPLFDSHRPAAIAACTRAEDVQACVDTARKARIPIAARSGGHSYAGYCTPNGGLVVDLAELSRVDVRPDGTATVGAGATLIDVYAALAKAAARCRPAPARRSASPGSPSAAESACWQGSSA